MRRMFVCVLAVSLFSSCGPKGTTADNDTLDPGDDVAQGDGSTTCQDECTDGAKTCLEGGVAVCGQNDEDTCLEWGAVTACGTGQICQEGECVTDKCTEGHQCESLWAAACTDDTHYQVCGFDPVSECRKTGLTVKCGPENTCNAGKCAGKCILPEVIVLLDRSASMKDDDRWTWLKASMEKWVNTYESVVALGLKMFPSGAECGVGDPIPFAKDNAAAFIAGMIDPPDSGAAATPIAAALTGITLGDVNQGEYVILITDGTETCNTTDPVDSVLDQVKILRTRGVTVIPVAIGTDADMPFLEKVASASGYGKVLTANSGEEMDTLLAALPAEMGACCVDNDVDGYGPACSSGSDCNDNDPTLFQSVCDGKKCGFSGCADDSKCSTPACPDWGNMTGYDETAPWPSPFGGPTQVGHTNATGTPLVQDGPNWKAWQEDSWQFSITGTTTFNDIFGVDRGQPILGSNGTVYVSTNDSLIGVDSQYLAFRCGYRFENDLADYLPEPPVIGADGTLYLLAFKEGISDAKLLAFDADCSTLKWTFDVGGDRDVKALPVPNDYTTLYWDVSTRAPVIGWDGTVFVATSGDYSRLVAITPGATPTEKWEYVIADDNEKPNGLAIDKDRDRIYLITRFYARAFRLADGELLFEAKHDDLNLGGGSQGFRSLMIHPSGWVITKAIGTYTGAGRLLGFNPDDFSLALLQFEPNWANPAPTDVASRSPLAIGPDGSIYAIGHYKYGNPEDNKDFKVLRFAIQAPSGGDLGEFIKTSEVLIADAQPAGPIVLSPDEHVLFVSGVANEGERFFFATDLSLVYKWNRFFPGSSGPRGSGPALGNGAVFITMQGLGVGRLVVK